MATTIFRMDDSNITMVRGDTLALGINITDEDGEPLNVDSAYFSCKKNYDEPYAFQKSLNDGITKSSDGNYVVRVAPADTADLDAGLYFYDLQVEKNGDVFTVLIGSLNLMHDVTTN